MATSVRSGATAVVSFVVGFDVAVVAVDVAVVAGCCRCCRCCC